MKKIKTMIVGLGKIGLEYDYYSQQKNIFYTHAKSINALSEFQLIAGVDKCKKKRKLFSTLYKKKTYKNFDYAMINRKPHLLVLSTPTETHINFIKKLKKYKFLKYLVCEKPLAYNLRDAKNIINICKNNKIKIFVNYFRLSEPSTLKLKIIFKKKKALIGKMYYSKGFLNNSSHYFNLFEYLFGKFKSGNVIKKYKSKKKYDYLLNYKVKFQNAQIFFKCMKDDFNQFKFYVTDNKINFKYMNNGKKLVYSDNNNKSFLKSSTERYQLNFYKELLKSINKKKSNICTGNQALNTLINMFKIFKNYEI
jgi:hypothetical protein